MKNLRRKIPFTLCAGLCLSLPVVSCLFEAVCVHIIKWLTVPELLWYRCPDGICIFTSCYFHQHHILWIQYGCVSRKAVGFLKRCPAGEPGRDNALWPGYKGKVRHVRKGHSVGSNTHACKQKAVERTCNAYITQMWLHAYAHAALACVSRWLRFRSSLKALCWCAR